MGQGGHGLQKRYFGIPFAFCEQGSAFQAVQLCMLTVILILNRLLRKQSARRAAGATVRALKVVGFSRRQRQRRAETPAATTRMSPNAHRDLGQRPDLPRGVVRSGGNTLQQRHKKTRLQEKEVSGVVSRPS